jgi:hypothetical protein
MTAPADWLQERLSEAPHSLRQGVLDIVARGALTRRHRDFAEDLLDVANGMLSSPASPVAPVAPVAPVVPVASALDLLTADTLVTLACEWVAENDPERLGELR